MNDNVLISKVEHYGVRGTVLSWFENYLANRQQYVKFNDIHSKSYQIKCGVPQGSILAPPAICMQCVKGCGLYSFSW